MAPLSTSFESGSAPSTPAALAASCGESGTTGSSGLPISCGSDPPELRCSSDSSAGERSVRLDRNSQAVCDCHAATSNALRVACWTRGLASSVSMLDGRLLELARPLPPCTLAPALEAAVGERAALGLTLPALGLPRGVEAVECVAAAGGGFRGARSWMDDRKPIASER